MLLNRFSPISMLNDVRTTFNLFDELTSLNRPALGPTTFPALNAWEDDNAFHVEAELPGMSLEQLDISVTDGKVLNIKGDRKECCEEGAHWLQRERGCGAFERYLRLPTAIDIANVDATFSQGVLLVNLPKAAEVRPLKINVKAV